MLSKKKILVVEDNDLNREMLSAILSEEYYVLQAENGKVALDILSKNADSIALILLDIVMPIMDGYTFLEIIKSDENLSLIPVIVMTQNDSEDDEVSALSHGATDFVSKPYRPQVILHRVASLISLRENAAMVNQFRYDRLTGLYRKEFFYQKVRERLEENPNEEYSIVCSNVENFKLYNDTFGIKAGDALLKEIAEKLKSMVGDDGICGRYSADRFMCLQKREREKADREYFFSETYSEQNGSGQNVSMKWGIYEITNRELPIEHMCDRALLAADSVKGHYNHPFAIYDDNMRFKLLREKHITDAMEAAISEEQFVIYFQPKYSLSDECLAGAEALVRWVHPEWGILSPGEFIPLFEKNGFIPRLDGYVWEHVLKTLQDWKEKGYPQIPVSVNVSRADIFQPHLADTLLGLTKKYGIDPEYLHLEITESAYTENPGQIVTTINQLRHLGFIVEMDDFGSGYSSLNMFSQVRIDILKLDMKFIRNETAKPAEQSILDDIIAMAHRMHLSVVAEGVETKEQVKRLYNVGCDYIQGYFFAKPMPVAEFEELLKTKTIHKVQNTERAPQYDELMLKILVADEDEKYREKVRRAFSGIYTVIECSDAQSAMENMRLYANNGLCAVILSMDLPENGIETIIKMVRREPSFWYVPVLATISNGEAIEKLPMALETDDFICKCHPIFDLQRRIERLVEITNFKKHEIDLKDKVNRDYITGLLNRRGLKDAMASIRKDDLPLAVCLFDLDDLKKCNDNHGHSMGDKIIRSFADLICRKTREDDIKCRYGGDEFLVILKRVKNSAAAVSRGEDICRSFREYFASENIPSACSVGIAICGVDENPTEGLIERADKALYHAKRENKGGCCLFEE
ncbi:MAG: EAL domain-containing protein [Eubacteriales bacterium]